jgi:anti-anti-sigma factor
MSGPAHDKVAIVTHPCAPGVIRLEVAGELDLVTVGRLQTAVDEVLQTPQLASVEIDLAQVAFLDSSAVSVLVRSREQAAAGGVHLRVVALQAIPLRVLTVTGVLELLTTER